MTPVSAQTTIPPEQVTPTNGWTCQDAGMGLGRNCTHADGRTASCRTVSAGGVLQETCTVSGAPTSNEEETTPTENPSPTTLPQNSTAPAGNATTPTGSEFVPLTSIPAIENINAEDGLSGFFNYLYVLAVGAAAVIAVLQFVRAGILYAVMNTGVVEKREARHLMLVSVLGLLLVLSPALVFGIINPDILSLRIGDNYGSGITQTPDPDSNPLSNLTCDSFPELGTTGGVDSAVITWKAGDRLANGYEQCCGRFADAYLSGSSCEVVSVGPAGTHYCSCSSIESKWHLDDGNMEGGGLQVAFQRYGGFQGSIPMARTVCVLGATEDMSEFFSSEEMCETAYNSTGKIGQKIKAGLLLPFDDGSGSCIDAVADYSNGETITLGVVGGPVCAQRVEQN